MDTEIKENDIVQIIDESHPWFPSLLIVVEVKPFGVMAGCIVPESGDQKPSVAYTRISFFKIKKVGTSLVNYV